MPADGPGALQAGLSIRRADPADLPAIQAFLRQAYGPLAAYKAEPRWAWQFADNPVHLFDDATLPVWIALAGHEVVGQIAVQATRFLIGDVTVRGGWIVDVMVLPAFRGFSLGHRLYDAVARDVPLLMMLTMAPATRRMAARAGAVTLNAAAQYSRWTNIRPQDVRRHVLQRLSSRPRLHAVAVFGFGGLHLHWLLAAGANAMTAIRTRRFPSQPRTPSIQEIEQFDAETDEFWARVSPFVHAAAVRDSVFLNWRYRQCPDLTYRCFVARDGETVVGYSILRRTEPVERRQGIIADILVMPGDRATYRALVLHALNVFGRNVATIECVTSQPDMAVCLRQLGFVRTRVTSATASALDTRLTARLAQSPRSWYFTKGDHDWDQIHLAPL